MSRVCVSIGDFLLEVEGEDSFVKNQIEKFVGKDIQSLITENMPKQASVTNRTSIIEMEDPNNSKDSSIEELKHPTYSALKKRKTIKFQWEWLLLIAYDISDRGEKDGALMEEIRNKAKDESLYVTGESFAKNYANNIARLENDGYINRFENKFWLTEDGKSKAEEILSR
jgi:hypothetical protein